MNVFSHFMAVFLVCLCTVFRLRAQIAEVPFSIELEEVTWSDWPGLHSFAIGEWDNRWLIICGRTGGLHGFLPPNPFPIIEANNLIRMFDPVSGEQWSANTFSLSDDLRDQLRSTNTQFFQRDKYLYIIGGYGKDTLTDVFITFPTLIAVDLELLSDALINETNINGAFRKFNDTLFCVTGGEIEIFNNKVYLFGGHVFSGEYTKPASDAFIQTYTNELRKFILEDDGINITISEIEQIKDTVNFHRRDLNFEPVIFPGEQFGLVAFSGVFQYEADWVWFNPIYVMEDGYELDTSFTQKLNGYSCPVMNIYDSVSQNYYATLFGGTSQFYHNEDEDSIKEDLNIPFINDISTIVRYADGSTEQILEPIKFDALLGTNAVFIVNKEIPQYENKVIRLHNIYNENLAGYIYGGIDALVPNFTPSTASNRLFKVLINYENPVVVEHTIFSEINIYPNPANDQLTIIYPPEYEVSSISIINQLGEIMMFQQTGLNNNYSILINISLLPSGFYFLKTCSSLGCVISELIKK